MLVGRHRESARVQGLVEELRDGRGGALLVHGEPGIGKSVLLDVARGAAGVDVRVLHARGFETESELPFAGLWELIAPLLELREQLPPAQALALGQALALDASGTPDRFAVPAALLGLLHAAATTTPVLALVDDAQWLDAPSLEAVLFAARRMGPAPVALLLAARDEAGRAVDGSGIPDLALGGLDADAAAELVRRAHGEELGEGVLADLVRAAAGNPLALVELPRVLTPGQLAGTEALPPVLPEGLVVESAFRRQIDELPEDARRALVVAAAADGGELAQILGGLDRLGLPPAALDAAEAAGIVVTADVGRLRFRHPLLRAAAYNAVPAPERRHVHRALADALPASVPARAWHRAAATVGRDEVVAADLEAAGHDAQRRGGHGSATRAFARAAELSPGREDRARRTLAAALAAAQAGQPAQAERLADATLPLTEDVLVRAGAQRVRGHVMLRDGRPVSARAPLAEAGALLEPDLPQAAAVVVLEAGLARLLSGSAAEAAAHGERALALAGGIEVLEASADVLAGQGLLAQGDMPAGEARFARREAFLLDAEPLPGVWEVIVTGAHGSMWTERFDRAQAVLDAMVDRARAEGALAELPYPLSVRAQLGFRRGRWRLGLVDADEAARLARETGQASALAYALGEQAELSAALGDAEAARAHVAAALALDATTETRVFGPYARSVLGTLALAEGDLDAAIAELERAREDIEAAGLPAPGAVFWTAELVEAHARAGQPAAAAEEAAWLDRLIGPRHPPIMRALHARARALAAAPGSDEEGRWFAEALAHHEASATPFEHARTQLLIGERRGDEAALRAACEAFGALGATLWATRVRAALGEEELVAPVASGPAPAALLTPQELQVALTVARGATNREAAATLGVSPKTVEHHLGHAYRKLGIRSRAQLAPVLAAELAAA